MTVLFDGGSTLSASNEIFFLRGFLFLLTSSRPSLVLCWISTVLLYKIIGNITVGIPDWTHRPMILLYLWEYGLSCYHWLCIETCVVSKDLLGCNVMIFFFCFRLASSKKKIVCLFVINLVSPHFLSFVLYSSSASVCVYVRSLGKRSETLRKINNFTILLTSLFKITKSYRHDKSYLSSTPTELCSKTSSN